MHTHGDQTEDLCKELMAIAVALIKNPPRRIGYRERVLIERQLFLILKDVCRRHLGYELQGLSETHRRRIEDVIKGSTNGHRLFPLLRDTFELKIFLLSLSSANPYVQGDALSRASIAEQDVPRTLAHALFRIVERVKEQIDDQSPHADHVGRPYAPYGPTEA
jgi:hypothetical protein